MKKEIKITEGIYFPFDGVWNTPENAEVFERAKKLYEDYSTDPSIKYVALIQSHHWASHGYWIEFTKQNCVFPDLLLKEHIKP